MNKSIAVALLSGALSGAGCGSQANNADAGPTKDAGQSTATDVCSPDSSTYVGFLDLSRSAFVSSSPTPHAGFLMGGDVRFFQNGPPYAPAPSGQVPAVLCDTPAVGQCCSVPLPSHPDADAGAARVGPEYVTCLDQQTGNTNGATDMSDPYGAGSWSVWAGGDSLDCSVDGGVFGAFSTIVSTPLDFTGLGEDVFPADGGSATLSKAQDVSMSWTAGSASSNVVINLFGPAGGVSCLAADTGSFKLPSSFLSQFSTADRGYVSMYRYAATCVQAPSVQLSVLVENGVQRAVVFQ